jgi:hypothetical protein
MLLSFVDELGPPVSSVADGTRPGTTFGTPVTPAQNAFGSYAQLVAGAAVTQDVHEVFVCVNSAFAVAGARDTLVTIGVDLGAGYVEWIPQLVCGPAGAFSGAASNGGPVWFRVPVRIPAGATVGARASVNSSNLTAVNVAVDLRGGPSRPELARAGGYVDAVGVVAASSRGTLVTPGTTADGAWTLIGTLARECFYLAWGVGCDDATMSNNTLTVDLALGDASSKRVVVANGYAFTAANEAIGRHAQGVYALGAAGDGVYARAQVGPNAGDSNYSVAAYAVGG